MQQPKFVIKPENITTFEIEMNDGYKEENLTQEEKGAVNAALAKFDEEVVQRYLLSIGAPCECQMTRMVQRAQARARLLPPNPTGQIPVDVTQEDVDSREFGVVIKEENGYPKEILAAVVGCKGCHKVEIYGEASDLTMLIAGGVHDSIEYKRQLEQEAALKAATAGNPMYVMENLETGEQTPADDLMEALFGQAAKQAADPDSLKLETIPDTGSN